MGLKHPTTKSFYYALQGFKTAVINEPNMRVHLIATSLSVTLGIVLEINSLEWMLLACVIFFVITLELLNTVLEAIVNLVSPNVEPYAKVAKDVSAACVLMAALLSIIVGSILFLPKIFILLQGL